MKRIFLLLWIPIIAFGQTNVVKTDENEPDFSFVKRVTGESIVATEAISGCNDASSNCEISLINQITRTRKLFKNQESILAFTYRKFDSNDSSSNEVDVAGHFLLKKTNIKYVHYEHPSICEVEGGSPTLRSFFYVDINHKSSPVLAVICGWNAQHAAADCAQTDEVRFFTVNENGINAIPMESYKKTFYRKIKSNTNLKMLCSEAKFQSAEDVKALLYSHGK